MAEKKPDKEVNDFIEGIGMFFLGIAIIISGAAVYEIQFVGPDNSNDIDNPDELLLVIGVYLFPTLLFLSLGMLFLHIPKKYLSKKEEDEKIRELEKEIENLKS